jgi:AcrR family transcriptional regulator
MVAHESREGGSFQEADAARERREKSDRRREELLDAADAAIERVGQQVSANLIAREAGVTKPIIYRHFGDIQDLYRALADRHERRLAGLQLQARLRDAHLDRFGRFRSIVAAYFDVIEREQNLYRFLVHAGGDIPNGHGAISWFTRRYAEDIAGHLAQITGQPKGSTQTQAMGFAMAGALTTAGSWWLQEQTAKRDDVVDALTRMLLSGLPQQTSDYELPSELPDR